MMSGKKQKTSTREKASSYEEMPPLTIKLGDKVCQDPRERHDAILKAAIRKFEDLIDRITELGVDVDNKMRDFGERVQAMELELIDLKESGSAE